MVPPYLGDDHLNKPKSTLLEDVSIQYTAILAHWFLRRRFFEKFSLFIDSYVKLQPPTSNCVPILVCLELPPWYFQTQEGGG